MGVESDLGTQVGVLDHGRDIPSGIADDQGHDPLALHGHEFVTSCRTEVELLFAVGAKASPQDPGHDVDSAVVMDATLALDEPAARGAELVSCNEAELRRVVFIQ